MTAQTSAPTDPTGPSRTEIDQTLRAILRDVLGLSEERTFGQAQHIAQDLSLIHI